MSVVPWTLNIHSGLTKQALVTTLMLSYVVQMIV